MCVSSFCWVCVMITTHCVLNCIIFIQKAGVFNLSETERESCPLYFFFVILCLATSFSFKEREIF